MLDSICLAKLGCVYVFSSPATLYVKTAQYLILCTASSRMSPSEMRLPRNPPTPLIQQHFDYICRLFSHISHRCRRMHHLPRDQASLSSCTSDNALKGRNMHSKVSRVLRSSRELQPDYTVMCLTVTATAGNARLEFHIRARCGWGKAANRRRKPHP